MEHSLSLSWSKPLTSIILSFIEVSTFLVVDNAIVLHRTSMMNWALVASVIASKLTCASSIATWGGILKTLCK